MATVRHTQALNVVNCNDQILEQMKQYARNFLKLLFIAGRINCVSTVMVGFVFCDGI